jgi:hypothetical protein
MPLTSHVALSTAAPARLLSQSRYAALLVSCTGAPCTSAATWGRSAPWRWSSCANYLDGQRASRRRWRPARGRRWLAWAASCAWRARFGRADRDHAACSRDGGTRRTPMGDARPPRETSTLRCANCGRPASGRRDRRRLRSTRCGAEHLGPGEVRRGRRLDASLCDIAMVEARVPRRVERFTQRPVTHVGGSEAPGPRSTADPVPTPQVAVRTVAHLLSVRGSA